MFKGAEPPIFRGTTFSLWSPRYWITAAHCLENAEANEIFIQFEDGSESGVRRIEKHCNADIAILVLEGHPPFQQNYFRSVVPANDYGFEINTFGYPEDTLGPNAGRQVPRFFKGHYQRVFEHHSHMNYQYQAAELSIACPAGLSGGPVFGQQNSSAVIGLVCENLESSLWLDSIEVEEGVRDNHYKMLNYGVSLQLDPLRPWLEEIIEHQR